MAAGRKTGLTAAYIVQMAKPTVPVFDVVLPDDLTTGVSAVSFVLNPAIQHPFVALAEATPTRLHLSAEPMQQIVTGPALVPDQPILRLSADNRPYYIRFSAETIAAISRRFMASANLAKTTDEHAIALAGNQVVENWLVIDPAQDKSTALGLNVQKGTWMLSIHIPDTTYWNEEILSGKRTGFSIEALLDLMVPDLSKYDETTLTATPTPQKKSLMARLRAIFLSYENLEDGSQIEIDDQTAMVYVVDADGNRGEALPDGDYKLDSGDSLTVKDGKKSDAVADAAPEMAADAPTAEQPAEEKPSADGAEFAAKLDELQAEIDALKSKLAESELARTEMAATVTDLNTKLAAVPAAKPVKLAVVASATEQTPAQRRLAQLRAQRA